jgi:dipeptidyl aminopeptidase/acylaminoacyl peptidase
MKAGKTLVVRAVSTLALALSGLAGGPGVPGACAQGLPANPPPPGAGQTVSFDVHAGTSYSVSPRPTGNGWPSTFKAACGWCPPRGHRRRITDYYNDAHLPVWSPDGARLAYYAYRDGDYDLWTVRPDGSDARQLTHGEDDDRDPAWSPDGKSVAFASDRAGSYDIWTVDVADGALRQITGGVREDRAPAWSADGKTIAFSGTQGTRNGIYSVPVQGGEATPLGIAPAGAHYDAPSLGGGVLSYVALDSSGSHLIVDGKPVSGQENVFPFPALAGGGAYYISDGLIRHRVAGHVTSVPFSARLEATKPEYTRVKRDFTSTTPRPVLGIDHPALSPDGKQIAFTALGDLWWCRPRAASRSN